MQDGGLVRENGDLILVLSFTVIAVSPQDVQIYVNIITTEKVSENGIDYALLVPGMVPIFIHSVAVKVLQLRENLRGVDLGDVLILVRVDKVVLTALVMVYVFQHD